MRQVAKIESDVVSDILITLDGLKWEETAMTSADTPPSDPEVWLPPTPIKISLKKPIPKPVAIKKPQTSLKPAPKSAEIIRKKPTQQTPIKVPTNYGNVGVPTPLKTKENVEETQEEDNGEDDSEKEFDSTGWDSELVEMVKRDMLQKKPSVHWSDISGLEEVKRLLTEAIMLPTIVPEFFRVKFLYIKHY